MQKGAMVWVGVLGMAMLWLPGSASAFGCLPQGGAYTVCLFASTSEGYVSDCIYQYDRYAPARVSGSGNGHTYGAGTSDDDFLLECDQRPYGYGVTHVEWHAKSTDASAGIAWVTVFQGTSIYSEEDSPYGDFTSTASGTVAGVRAQDEAIGFYSVEGGQAEGSTVAPTWSDTWRWTGVNLYTTGGALGTHAYFAGQEDLDGHGCKTVVRGGTVSIAVSCVAEAPDVPFLPPYPPPPL